MTGPVSGLRGSDGILKALISPSLIHLIVSQCNGIVGKRQKLGGGAYLEEAGHSGMPFNSVSCSALLAVSPCRWGVAVLCRALPP